MDKNNRVLIEESSYSEKKILNYNKEYIILLERQIKDLEKINQYYSDKITKLEKINEKNLNEIYEKNDKIKSLESNIVKSNENGDNSVLNNIERKKLENKIKFLELSIENHEEKNEEYQKNINLLLVKNKNQEVCINNLIDKYENLKNKSQLNHNYSKKNIIKKFSR